MIVLCFIYSGFSVTNMLRKPYDNLKYPVLNRVESIFLNIQAMMCWFGCFYFSLAYLNKNSFHEFFALAVLLLIALSNLVIFLFWLFSYWKFSAKFKLKEMYKSVKRRITNAKQTKLLNFFATLPPRNSIKVSYSIKNRKSEFIKEVLEIDSSEKNSVSAGEKSESPTDLIRNRIEELELLIATCQIELYDLRKKLSVDLAVNIHSKPSLPIPDFSADNDLAVEEVCLPYFPSDSLTKGVTRNKKVIEGRSASKIIDYRKNDFPSAFPFRVKRTQDEIIDVYNLRKVLIIKENLIKVQFNIQNLSLEEDSIKIFQKFNKSKLNLLTFNIFILFNC
jgi:hypothetical protein